MKATKYQVTVSVEVLSLDAVPGLLRKVEREMDDEVEQGDVSMSDGDRVAWEVMKTNVEF